MYNSECSEPLICRNKLCAYECLGKADCPAGLNCVDNRCSGNEAGPPCLRNSDCEEPLVCRSGQCTEECRKTVDCPPGQGCLERSCVIVPPGDPPTDWGNGCTYSEECSAPLVCRTNHCVYQCTSDADCGYAADLRRLFVHGRNCARGGGGSGGKPSTSNGGTPSTSNGGTSSGGSGSGGAPGGGSGGTAVIGTDCVPNAKDCLGNATRTCTADGYWGPTTDCTAEAQVCKKAQGCTPCPAGTKNCDGTISNGCEVNLNLVGSCGTSCSNQLVCSEAQGPATCAAGVCGTQPQPIACSGTITQGNAAITDTASLNAFSAAEHHLHLGQPDHFLDRAHEPKRPQPAAVGRRRCHHLLELAADQPEWPEWPEDRGRQRQYSIQQRAHGSHRARLTVDGARRVPDLQQRRAGQCHWPQQLGEGLQDLNIQYNSALLNLDGFPALAEVGGYRAGERQ